MTAFVKGFRTPASHWRDEILEGMRPKSLKGGNRGGVWGLAVGAIVAARSEVLVNASPAGRHVTMAE
jgi:hypothetical protein